MSKAFNLQEYAIVLESLDLAEKVVSSIIVNNVLESPRHEKCSNDKMLGSSTKSPARPLSARSSKDNVSLHRILSLYGDPSGPSNSKITTNKNFDDRVLTSSLTGITAAKRPVQSTSGGDFTKVKPPSSLLPSHKVIYPQSPRSSNSIKIKSGTEKKHASAVAASGRLLNNYQIASFDCDCNDTDDSDNDDNMVDFNKPISSINNRSTASLTTRSHVDAEVFNASASDHEDDGDDDDDARSEDVTTAVRGVDEVTVSYDAPNKRTGMDQSRANESRSNSSVSPKGRQRLGSRSIGLLLSPDDKQRAIDNNSSSRRTESQKPRQEEPADPATKPQHIRYTTTYQIGRPSRKSRITIRTAATSSSDPPPTQNPLAATDESAEPGGGDEDPERHLDSSGDGGKAAAAGDTSIPHAAATEKKKSKELQLQTVPLEDLVSAAACVVEEEVLCLLLSDCLTTLVRRDIIRPRSAAGIRSSGSSSSLKINSFRCGAFQPVPPLEIPAPALGNTSRPTSPARAKTPEQAILSQQHQQHQKDDTCFSFRIVSYPEVHPPTSTEPRYLHTSPPLTLDHLLSPSPATAVTAGAADSGKSTLSSPRSNRNRGLRRGRNDHKERVKGEFDHMAAHNKDQLQLPHIKQLLFELQLRVSTHSRNDKMNELRNAYDALHANDITVDEGEEGKVRVRRLTKLEPQKKINWNSIYTTAD